MKCLTRNKQPSIITNVVSTPVDLATGTIFANRYRVIRRIASGGMGAVFEVLHLETERRRALKVMHATLFQSDDLRERFRREARVAAHVDSEFIVDVFDAGVDDATGMPFLVMELLRGEELGERLKRVGRLEPDEVLQHLHYVALALEKTHQASIIHRDLKPANVFLTEREEGGVRVKVLDFGIAKIVAEGATTEATTQSLGTPLYMAPEQFNPRSKLTNAVDIYALGMMAYTLLVGSPYWFEEARGGNVYAIVALAIHGIPEPPSVRAAARGVHLPPAFDAWFAKATAVDPKQRFATATAAIQELAAAFGKGLAGRPSLPSAAITDSTSMPGQTAAAVTNAPNHSRMMGAGGTTRLGQVPDSTTMSAAATLSRSTAPRPVWPYVAAGCVTALSLGLLVFFLARNDKTSDSAPNAANTTISPTKPAIDPQPIASPALMTNEEKPPAPSNAITATSAAPLESAAATPTSPTAAKAIRPSNTTPIRTPTPATTPTSTSPRKKAYTRE